VKGVHGEKGFAIISAVLALATAATVLVVKYKTLNRQSTPQHWFMNESGVYALIVVMLCLSLLSMLFINGRSYWTRSEENEEDMGVIRPELSLFSSSALMLTASLFIADIVLVWRDRRSRTWIPFISSYKICV